MMAFLKILILLKLDMKFFLHFFFIKPVANCEQVLSTHTSRRCLVFEKIKETADFSDEEECRKKVRELAIKFRENFYKAQEIPRTERKERMKKFGHLNLENSEENST